jgi:cytidylate kinase
MSDNNIPIKIAQEFKMNNLDNPLLRNDESSQLASKVAIIPQVRTALLDYQRHFAINPPADGAVLDGRDIGTVICPLAPVKLFVTANVEVRAKRRHNELEKLTGQTIDFQIVLKDLKSRDDRDMNRVTAPLRPADDSVILDTTDMSIDMAIQQAIERTDYVMKHHDKKLFVCI